MRNEAHAIFAHHISGCSVLQQICIARVSLKRSPFREFWYDDVEVASRRVASRPGKAVESTARFSLSRDAELLRPWNVRDKLHERMPCGVTENGRKHLFSFSGHVTTASGRHILYATLYSPPRAPSRSRPTTIFHVY